MKKVLIVKRADLEFDVRCQRLAIYLSKSYDVTIVGTDLSPKTPVKQVKIADYDQARISIPARAYRKLRREVLLTINKGKSFEYRLNNDKWILELIKHLRSNEYQIVIACDIDSITAFINSGTRARIIGDMHEHAPTELGNSPGWIESVGIYRKWQCEIYLPEVKTLFTVSPSLARLYEYEFNIPKVYVLRNTSSYNPRIRSSSNNPPRNFIHHGIAAPIRKLEGHVELARALGSPYSVSMLLKPVNHMYYQHLRDCEKAVGNFHLLTPVEPSKMINEISKFDAGIYLLNPETPQLKVTLPNKFFEFVQARLPVFSGGLTEIDELIDQYGVGVKLETYDGVEAADRIRNNQDLDWKSINENLDFAAKELSSEVEFTKILNKIEELLTA